MFTPQWTAYGEECPTMTRTTRYTARALGVGAAAFALALAAPAMASAHDGENHAPTCDTARFTYTGGGALNFPVNDSCRDEDGDELVVESVGSVDGPGSAAKSEDGVSYTPSDDIDGVATFTALVSDGHEGEPTEWNFEITYEVPFELIATDDAFETKVNTAVTGNVTGNDKGADRAEITLLTEPEHGKLDFNEKTGEFTYTPDKDFSGVDTFTYELKGGKLVDSGKVTITVRPEGGGGGPGSPSPSPSKTKGPLAKTGADLTTLGFIGGGVLIAGAGALFVARRRRVL